VRRLTHLIFMCAVILAGALLVGCTGLAGEPVIVSSLVPPTALVPTPTEPAFPSFAADTARGAQVYAQHCTQCHGSGGAGDGALVQSGQVVDVASFLDPATASEQTPEAWFRTITQGRIEKLMPPWRDALSFEDRWAVALYTYTLHNTPTAIARGRELYALECAECHGESGRGDGERALRLRESPGDLSDPANMAFLDDGGVYVSIDEGIGDIMPAQGARHGGTWSDADVRAVTGYVRTLSLANAEAVGLAPLAASQVGQLASPAATAAVGAVNEGSNALTGAIRVTGTLTNGTAGAAVPAGVPLTLFVIDPSSDPAQTQIESATGADGSFAFDAVPISSETAIIVTANYRERVFVSEIARGDTLTTTVEAGTVDLPITIYELTDDPGVIAIRGMVTQVTVVGDGMEVAQVFDLRNTSDRAFTSTETTEDGRPISLVLPLPPGALVASLMGQDNRYVVPADNSVLIDTQMVLPGETHIVNVIYLVQYGGGAIIEQPLTYALDGAARLLVRPLDIAVTGEQFPARGVEQIGDASFNAYGDTLTLPAGSVLRYEVSGMAASAGTVDRGSGAVVTGSALPLVIGAVLIMAGVVGGGVYFIAARNRAAESVGGADGQIEALADAIADLDGDFAAGTIDETAYQTQRAALKARMARLIASKRRA